MKFKNVDIMKEIINCLHRLLVLTALFCFFVPSAFATPAIPVDRDTFSIGNTVTAEISAYGVKSTHTGYKEDDKNAKIFYTRQGRADPAQPLRFILAAKQLLPDTVQEVEFTAQPFEEMNRYAGKKMEKFYRKGKGGAGKRLNVNIEYKVPPKARMLVVTVQLKDYYQKGGQTLPRYTTVEYELRVIGFAEANAREKGNGRRRCGGGHWHSDSRGVGLLVPPPQEEIKIRQGKRYGKD